MRMDSPSFIKAGRKGSSGLLILSGIISPFENNSNEIISAMVKLENEGHKEINVCLLNFYGGTMFEGWPVFNHIRNSKTRYKTHVEGLCASMGFVIFLGPKGKENRTAAKYSRVMSHRANGSVSGNADQIESQAKLTREMEDDMVEVVSEELDMTTDKVKAEIIVSGKDVYFNTAEMLKLGLISKVTPGNIKEDLPTNLVTASADEIAKFYNSQINSEMAENKEEKTTPSPEAKASQEKLTQLEAENKALKEAEVARVKKEAETMVEAAVKAGKVKAEKKEALVKMAVNDLEGVKAILEDMKPHTPVSAVINQGGPGGTGSADIYAGWDFEKYQKEAPAALAKIRDTDPSRYNQLKEDYLERLKNS